MHRWSSSAMTASLFAATPKPTKSSGGAANASSKPSVRNCTCRGRSRPTRESSSAWPKMRSEVLRKPSKYTFCMNRKSAQTQTSSTRPSATA
ncbi:unnamed protein product [Oppiella nova]|uniref:Uncharacterized protein n=1 Tax=Oppiella nova TaxID=334625 RepID=A0A7R9R223_9ACAR|nr:unnamed protein product [Oppiella nova]CAG2182735.1 unnamed protein product [Oppiella nova]